MRAAGFGPQTGAISVALRAANASKVSPVSTRTAGLRTAIGAATIDAALLTAAEKLQYEGYLRREEPTPPSTRWPNRAATIKEIVRGAGYSRGLVRKVTLRWRPPVRGDASGDSASRVALRQCPSTIMGTIDEAGSVGSIFGRDRRAPPTFSGRQTISGA
jgi:hypothetical protein